MKISRRGFTSSALLVAMGCGRDHGAKPTATDVDAGASSENDGGVTPTDAGADAPFSSAALAPLTLHAAASGTFPYVATVFPLEGAVPQGQEIASDDDPTLRASVLSRWPDGSASVVVVAGNIALAANTAKVVTLRTTAAAAAAPLDAARVAALVTSITLDFGALGTGSLSQLATPERTWWQNERVVCCRYRVAIGAALEAVIDIHAFSSDRAFVEIVVENGKVDPTIASPPKPATAQYTDAKITVNGAVIATVSSPAVDQTYPSGRGSGSYAGGHEAHRAFYVATWVGGDPGVEVTHDVAAMQAHPLFFRCWRQAPSDFASDYENDHYEPWSAGRLNVPGMPGTGDIEGIGPLSQWDTRYRQSGSRFARRAVLASALGALSCNITYREGGGQVPTLAQTNGHDQDAGTWPSTKSEPSWELAHHPAVGLMAFLCRPSPVFIEIAQKVAVWNATCISANGIFGFWAQVRGKAWGIRSLAHAIFVTPDAHPWKAPAKTSLQANIALVDEFRKHAQGVLGFVWYPAPNRCADFETRNEGMQQPLWMHHWLATSLHAAASTKVLDGAAHTLLVDVADWAALQPVRYVNEANAGEWRLHNYLTTVGRYAVDPSSDETLGSGVYAVDTFDALPTYPANLAWYYTDAPPPSAGKFLFIETNPDANPSYRSWASAGESSAAGVSYAAIFWAALVVAVERNVAGADAAWTKVTTQLTNLDAWSQSFAAEPRYNRYPRNRNI